jgi:hypothetical protein
LAPPTVGSALATSAFQFFMGGFSRGAEADDDEKGGGKKGFIRGSASRNCGLSFASARWREIGGRYTFS